MKLSELNEAFDLMVELKKWHDTLDAISTGLAQGAVLNVFMFRQKGTIEICSTDLDFAGSVFDCVKCKIAAIEAKLYELGIEVDT